VNIYLDHAATTPMAPEAVQALTDQIAEFGNASSLHATGRSVRKKVEEARESIAESLGSAPSEVIFTGSGTEANNLAIKGFFWKAVAEDPRRNILIVSAFEHHAALEPVEWLVEHEGAVVRFLPVSEKGFIDLAALSEMIAEERDRIALICVMHANNEIGTIQPIREVVLLAGDIPVHCDAVQSFGKVPFHFEGLGLASSSVSAHKLGGPLGVAALILKRGIDITPVLHGGGQERDIRSGTLNAPSIVSFGVATRLAITDREQSYSRVCQLRDKLAKILVSAIPYAIINGGILGSDPGDHLPGILSVTFPGTDGDSLLLMLDNVGISTSTGSACSAGVQRTSHVLLSIGLSEALARGSLRFSLGRTTTEAEINRVGEVISDIVAKARLAYSAGAKHNGVNS
jgi:cysteine desulfurase